CIYFFLFILSLLCLAIFFYVRKGKVLWKILLFNLAAILAFLGIFEYCLNVIEDIRKVEKNVIHSKGSITVTDILGSSAVKNSVDTCILYVNNKPINKIVFTTNEYGLRITPVIEG